MIAILELIFHKNIIYERFVYNFYYDLYIASRRAMSTLYVPQVLGTYIIACLPLILFLITNGKGYFDRILGLSTMVFCIIALILTFSRGPLFGLIIALTFYFYKKHKKIIIPFLLLIMIITAVFSLCSSGSAAWRLGLSGWTAYSDYQHRATRIATVLKILRDHPFIGLGLENYRFLFDRYFFIKNAQWDWRVTDNMYLTILGESGMLGFFAFMCFIVLLLRRTYKNYNEFGFALFIALIGILCNMMTYDMLYWTAPFYIFWIYCGMLSSLGLERSV